MSEERTRHWLDSIDDVESIVESSIIDSSDSESGEELALGTHRSFDQSTVVTSKLYPTNTVPLHLDIFISSEQINNHLICIWIYLTGRGHHSDSDDEQYNDITSYQRYQELENLEQLLSRLPPPSFGNVSVSNSTNVVMGNIIKIKGDLIVNVKKDEENNNGENKKKDSKVSENDSRLKDVEILQSAKEDNNASLGSDTAQQAVRKQKTGSRLPDMFISYTA